MNNSTFIDKKKRKEKKEYWEIEQSHKRRRHTNERASNKAKLDLMVVSFKIIIIRPNS